MMPTPFSGPAGIITAPTETETPVSTCSGFQFISATLRIDWAANFGVAMVISTSIPADCRVTSWLSIVASVTSYEAVVTCLS